MESLKRKTFKGTLWNAVENFSLQGIQFIVMLVMARLLTPSDYGVVGMLSIFIAVSQTLINSGFSQALIRKTNRTETDNSTVFFFNIAVGILLYFILFFTAPLIAKFYNEPLLTPITRVVSINLIFNSLVVVQRAQFTLTLNFKTQAKATLTGAILSGAVGIILAIKGFGVWAIVWQTIINMAVVTVLLWVLSSWRPKWCYSWQSFRELFGFGSKLLVSGLIDTLYNNIYQLVIGKVYKASDLGYYTRARQFSSLASQNLTAIIQRVTYPALCTIQDEDERLANGYRMLLRLAVFIIFPIMMGLVALSKPLILTLLTERWIYAATLLVPICFSGMWYPVHAINLNLLQVKGKSSLFLKLEIIKKLVGIIILCITIPMGLLAMCWGGVLTSLIALVINTHYTGKLLDLGFMKQMRDILPVLILSLVSAGIVYITILWLPVSELLKLIIGMLEGVGFYLLVAKILRFQEFTEIRNLLFHRNS